MSPRLNGVAGTVESGLASVISRGMFGEGADVIERHSRRIGIWLCRGSDLSLGRVESRCTGEHTRRDLCPRSNASGGDPMCSREECREFCDQSGPQFIRLRIDEYSS